MGLILKLHKDLDENFWKDFDLLSKQTADHIVQCNSIWFKAYIKAYLLKGQLRVFSLYSNDELVGCLPLQMHAERATRFWNYRVLKVLGVGPTDFFNVLVSPHYIELFVKLITENLLSKGGWDKVELTEFPEDSKFLKYLVFELKKNGVDSIIDKPNGFYYINFNTSWTMYYKDFFKSRNKDLIKSLRRMENDNIEWRVEKVTDKVFDSLMQHIKIYSERRASLGQKNSYYTEERLLFLQEVLREYEQLGGVELSFLRDVGNNDVMALQLDWVFNGIRYHWNHAYNENYKRYSPGKVLLKELMKESFEDSNMVGCNYMRGLSSYKTNFSNDKKMLSRVKFINNNSKRIVLTRIISKCLNLLNKFN